MTKSEEMKKFEAAVASDKELNEKFYKTVDRIAGEKTAQSDGNLFAKAAQELGFQLGVARARLPDGVVFAAAGVDLFHASVRDEDVGAAVFGALDAGFGHCFIDDAAEVNFRNFLFN